MTRTELLLTQLSEECNEVGQRASKAIRFGLDEIQKGQNLTNAERIIYEFIDLITVIEKLANENLLPNMQDVKFENYSHAKHIKIEKWLKYSEDCGVLEAVSINPILCGECWLTSGPDNSQKCKCLNKDKP